MKVIIAGSRSITNYFLLEAAISESKFDISLVISGHARGVDMLGEHWARAHDIPLLIVPARWDIYGKGAGPKRNQEMVNRADAAILLWDGVSRGTNDTYFRAYRKHIPMFKVVYQTEWTNKPDPVDEEVRKVYV